jgi:hypothetical protein
MKWCIWTKLPNGELWCKDCDPKQNKLQSTETRRNCNLENHGAHQEIRELIREIRPKNIVSAGPGTELKGLLRRFGIVAEVGCKCSRRAQRMDEEGCDWCERNLELITDWLEEEAERRKLPFVRSLGRLLVRRAIRKARKKSK